MTASFWALAVILIAVLLAWGVTLRRLEQVDGERRAERSQFMAALLARHPAEFSEAIRLVDRAAMAEGPKRRRRKVAEGEDEGPQIPIGL